MNPFKPMIGITAILCTSCLLTSCGGSGGGSDTQAANPTTHMSIKMLIDPLTILQSNGKMYIQIQSQSTQLSVNNASISPQQLINQLKDDLSGSSIVITNNTCSDTLPSGSSCSAELVNSSTADKLMGIDIALSGDCDSQGNCSNYTFDDAHSIVTPSPLFSQKNDEVSFSTAQLPSQASVMATLFDSKGISHPYILVAPIYNVQIKTSKQAKPTVTEAGSGSGSASNPVTLTQCQATSGHRCFKFETTPPNPATYLISDISKNDTINVTATEKGQTYPVYGGAWTVQ